MLIFQILCFMIIWSCNKIYKEFLRTKLICYKLRLEIAGAEISHDAEIMQELSLLVLHSKIRKCKILACNFLVVDYTLLYALFGVITSYTVVFLQFKIYK